MPGVKPEEQKCRSIGLPSKNPPMVPPENVSLGPNREFRITYVQQPQLKNFLSGYGNHVLAFIDYGRIQPAQFDTPGVSISIGMEQFNELPLTEVWTSSLPLSVHKVNGIHVAFNEEVVFGYVQHEGLDGIGLEEVVYSAYSRILDSLSTLGYPHLFRIWNYFPEINAEQKGLERYRRFCIGRHRAFYERYKEFKLFLPAASAVGTPSGPFQLYFIAGKAKAIHIENPRQISAYDYPRMYGPQSPSFARATFTSMPFCTYLFIAGTASIVGHATQHKDDCFKQTKETLSNIESLMKQVKKAKREVLPSNLSPSLLKVYLRHDQHIEIVNKTIKEHFVHDIPTLYLHGEMCRRNLLIEIEALYTIQRS